MEIKILENKAKRLVFELHGTDHTLCNALKDELSNTKDITIATYSVSHPLTGKPKFIIETKTTKPKDALTNAVDTLKKKNKTFLKAFKTL